MKSQPLSRCLIVLIACQCSCLASFAAAVWAAEDTPVQKSEVHTTNSARYHYPRPTFKITGKFSCMLQKCTGITYVSEITTDYLAQRILKKKFGGKIKVTVKTYSFTDLLHLKIRVASVRMIG